MIGHGDGMGPTGNMFHFIIPQNTISDPLQHDISIIITFLIPHELTKLNTIKNSILASNIVF